MFVVACSREVNSLTASRGDLAAALREIGDGEVTAGAIANWITLPARPAVFADYPPWLDRRLVEVLAGRGIHRLYTHQVEALESLHAGRGAVIVTPTASGKTLSYNLPVLHEIASRPETRALYIFPTKALAQDQMNEVHDFIERLGLDIKTFTYDGDTPPAARRAVRSAGHIVVTNPDMLHTGILPHHTKWVKLFENLAFVIIDEIHTYRGVFGSHVANIIRRLRRICRFYGSDPLFVACSATIANPLELASKITGVDLTLIDTNGAPSGPKHFIFYNPPVVNRELGIRRSSLLEARRLAETFLRHEVPTIVFARSRVTAEVLLSYIKEALEESASRPPPGRPARIRGYRGGYLPGERREIERGLRSGQILGVVATNALELGVNIGSLDAAVLTGYPGTIASTWQQAGRAGRRKDESVACLVASSTPLDQFIVANPGYFLERSPENGLVNADNPLIKGAHVKCAAFELPFVDGETLGEESIVEKPLPTKDRNDGDRLASTAYFLGRMESAGLLRHVGGRWHWSAESFPAETVSLRSADTDNFVVIDTSSPQPRVIAEMDRFSAPMLIHEGAIYLHDGRQYHVERLDWDDRKAYVHEVDVDYYTDASLAVTVKVLDVFRHDEAATGSSGPISPQPRPTETATASAPRVLRALLPRYHGDVSVTALPTIYKKIKLYTQDNVGWGRISLPEQEMHTEAVWLVLPASLTSGISNDHIQVGLVGLGLLMANVAPLYLMCDPRDIRAYTEVRSPFTGLPTIFLYDRYPGGAGLSSRLYDVLGEVLVAAAKLLAGCPCPEGCPSCVGPPGEVGPARPITSGWLAALTPPFPPP
jgi:DEAD/DEAH box helicase domain-containing protein